MMSAKTTKKTTQYYFISLIIIGLLGGLFYYVRHNSDNKIQTSKKTLVSQQSIAKKTPLPPSSNATTAIHYLPFHLALEKNHLSGQDNFIFAVNDFIAVQPLTKSLSDNLQQIVTYLNSHPFQQLMVTGRYHPNETNRSIFPNLGIARAYNIKDYLIFLGASEQQIAIDAQPYPEAVSDSQHNYLGMADFAIKTIKKNTQQAQHTALQQLAAEIQANPLVLYFQTGTSDIVLTEQQQSRLLTINRYLSYSPDAKILITGHTDSTGNRQKNIQLGRKRAEFAASYLEKIGLHHQQMLIDSKGPDEPIANNNSPEGRSKNRRVVISIKEFNN